MKPIKLQRMKRTNCWSPKGKVWYQKNDDNQERPEISLEMKKKKYGSLEEQKEYNKMLNKRNNRLEERPRIKRLNLP